MLVSRLSHILSSSDISEGKYSWEERFPFVVDPEKMRDVLGTPRIRACTLHILPQSVLSPRQTSLLSTVSPAQLHGNLEGIGN